MKQQVTGSFDPLMIFDRFTHSATLHPSSRKSTLQYTPWWIRDQFSGLRLWSETTFRLGHIGAKKPLILTPTLQQIPFAEAESNKGDL